MRSFVKTKSSRNGEIICRLLILVNHAIVANFSATNMSLNEYLKKNSRENFRIYSKLYLWSKTHCFLVLFDDQLKIIHVLVISCDVLIGFIVYVFLDRLHIEVIQPSPTYLLRIFRN